ncbi:hypothetical protein CA13_69660 [Planctomycetes bacterium CA13]|uniref:Uncharacterized protein n=1 Tax=Novipirellula herctigrandis TaxID=2527986 RepID=A0A5C5YNE4_9BACT|nr:hypothetical protein CA13_69660 [Planctomycetes bacterium CA13]
MIIYDCEPTAPSAEHFLDYTHDPSTEYYRCGDATPTSVRVGSRSRQQGPAGHDWTRVQLARTCPEDAEVCPSDAVEYYQQVQFDIIRNALIVVGGNNSVEIPVHNASREELELFNNTFCDEALVPIAHLNRVLEIRPNGIHVESTTGRPGGSLSYMGGLNQSNRIVITHGSLWGSRRRGISETVLHEIGHVMTHRGNVWLNVSSHDVAQMRTGTSRNRGGLEGLCDAYMYFLCYGSNDTTIQQFGERNGNRTTRDILRRSLAFSRISSDDLSSDWTSRLAEREPQAS